jgi:hypothetical protein
LPGTKVAPQHDVTRYPISAGHLTWSFLFTLTKGAPWCRLATLSNNAIKDIENGASSKHHATWLRPKVLSHECRMLAAPRGGCPVSSEDSSRHAKHSKPALGDTSTPLLNIASESGCTCDMLRTSASASRRRSEAASRAVLHGSTRRSTTVTSPGTSRRRQQRPYGHQYADPEYRKHVARFGAKSIGPSIGSKSTYRLDSTSNLLRSVARTILSPKVGAPRWTYALSLVSCSAESG